MGLIPETGTFLHQVCMFLLLPSNMHESKWEHQSALQPCLDSCIYLVVACAGCVRWQLGGLQWCVGGRDVGWRRSFDSQSSCRENIV